MAQFWVPHKEEVFVPGTQIKSDGDSTTYKAPDGSQVVLKKNETEGLEQVFDEQLSKCEDVTTLSQINEGAMLHTVRQRYLEDEKIYTNVARILIAMNPFKGLPIYSKEQMDKYANGGDGAGLPPHIYGIGQDAMNGLRHGTRDQAILISGESGAGKTESAKLVLSYVGEAVSKGKSGGLEDLLLRTNPILEAFGNAMTVRNNNSSRFGKWLDINFQEMRMVGCTLTSYLLEATRVTSQGKGERGYHVFFQLLDARDKADLAIKDMQLGEPKSYRYLSGGEEKAPTIADGKCFAEMCEAYTALKFPESQQKEIMKILGAILTIGNTDFKDNNDEAEVADDAPVKKAAGLLGVPEENLSKLMTKKKIMVGRESMEKPVKVEVAGQLRDSVSRLIYGRLFLWLLERMNKELVLGSAPASGEKKALGVLDIAGFEDFAINSLEQLLINLSNEHLQQQFNNTVFKTELDDYKKEGLDIQIDFADNKDVLELLDGKGGLLDQLDEAVSMPKCTDLIYVGNCLKAHEKQPRMVKPKFAGKAEYGVKHFAGIVQYCCDGFMEKNADKPPDELTNVMQMSSLEILKALGDSLAEASAGAAAGPGVKKKLKTAALGFRTQLKDLMKKINDADPHYIRCIKPNLEKVSGKVTSVLVHQQLKFSGVFDAISIRKQGFGTRIPYEEFVKRYSFVCDAATRKSLDTKSTDIAKKKAAVDAICAGAKNANKDFEVPAGQLEVGKTKVLMKQPAYNALQKAREQCITAPVIRIQCTFRRHKVRKAMHKAKKVHKEVETFLAKYSVFDEDKRKEELKNKKRLTVTRVTYSALSRYGSYKEFENHLEKLEKILKDADEVKLANGKTFEAGKVLKRMKIEQTAANDLKQGETSIDVVQMGKWLARGNELGLPDDETTKKVRDRIEALNKQLGVVNGMKGVLKDEGMDDEQFRVVKEALDKSGFQDDPSKWLKELDGKHIAEQFMEMWNSRTDLHAKPAEPEPAGGQRRTLTGCNAVDVAKILFNLDEAAKVYDIPVIEEMLTQAVNQGIEAEKYQQAESVYQRLMTEAFLTQMAEDSIEAMEEPDPEGIVAKQLQNLALQIRKLQGDTDLYKRVCGFGQKSARKTLQGANAQALLGSIFQDLSTYEKLKPKVVENKEVMLFHQMDCLTEALTVLDNAKDNDPKACTAFRNMMIGMYDKPASDIEVMSARQAIMESVCTEEALRNEIYCQVIKQIRNNPNHRSILMGWQLLRFLCEAAPPREDFLEYVEAFATVNLESDIEGIPDQDFLETAGIPKQEWHLYIVSVRGEALKALDGLQRPTSWLVAGDQTSSCVHLVPRDAVYDDSYDQNMLQQQQWQQGGGEEGAGEGQLEALQIEAPSTELQPAAQAGTCANCTIL